MSENTRLEQTSILISDVDRRKALPIIRSLGRSGVQVIGLSKAGFSVGGLSRHCNLTLRCPDHLSEPDAWVSFVEETCREYRPTTFLPLEDNAITLCLDHPDCFEPFTRALLPSREAMEVSYDKWKTLELARRVGVRIPESHCPQHVEEVRELARGWQGGAVVKPRKTSGSRGMLFVNDPGALEAAWVEVSREFPRPIVQQRIDATGPGLGVFVLIDEKGQLLGLFGHKRLREYPIQGGPSTLCCSHRDESLIEQSLTLLREMNFHGIAMIEFKVDATTGEPVLMEINPRFWGSIGLAVAAGVDFPLLYHKCAAGLPVHPTLEYPPDVHGRWLFPGDLLHFLKNPNRMHLEPSFFWLRGRNLHYDILSLRDPAPALGMLVEGLRRALGHSS